MSGRAPLERLRAARGNGQLTDDEYNRRIEAIEGWLRAKGVYFRPGHSLRDV